MEKVEIWVRPKLAKLTKLTNLQSSLPSSKEETYVPCTPDLARI